jgi:hypothetical protein
MLLVASATDPKGVEVMRCVEIDGEYYLYRFCETRKCCVNLNGYNFFDGHTEEAVKAVSNPLRRREIMQSRFFMFSRYKQADVLMYTELRHKKQFKYNPQTKKHDEVKM